MSKRTAKSEGFYLFSRLGLIMIAAVMLGATSLIQYVYSINALKEEAALRAQSELDGARSEIMDIVNQTESSVRNSIWIAKWVLENSLDSMMRVPQRIVQDNPGVAGSTLAVVPGYMASTSLCAPYVFRSMDGKGLEWTSLATSDYDYPSKEWFVKPLELGEGYWSEPYFDEGGGNFLMTTYSMPILDSENRPAAVVTADISLSWLGSVVDGMTIYPIALNTITSRGGQTMVSAGDPPRSGEKCLVYSAQVERTGWSMSITLPEREVYAGIRKVGYMVNFLQVIGLLMLVVILQLVTKSQRKYQQLDKQRERMQGELKIASDIQMAMVPKEFPPFPERHDLDMAADIVPAKEVGGDLYDYFIRDGKLFFCIGDVSGKGIPASLVMAVTRTSFRNLSAGEESPGRIIQAMNDSLSAMNDNSMFVTFFCGVLDLESGRLRYCNAGHNPPRILSKSIQELPVLPNLPLGVMAGWDYEEQELQLYYDDALFLYTDGLTEAENLQHEQFGEMRMEKGLHGRSGAYEHLVTMENLVKDFVGEAPQSDDLTMLFIHYLGKDSGEYGPTLLLHNDIRQIPRLKGWMDYVGSEYGVGDSLLAALNLAIEEALTNVIMYAYPKGSYGCIELRVGCESRELTFTLMDSGVAFDPTAAPEADITLSVQERSIGGLGIHLVRQIMDKVSYERKDGNNILTMKKTV